jgi:hypothetical protein
MISSFLFAGFLVGLAGLMMVLHWRKWRWLRTLTLADKERDFFFRQFRRRMQSSAMIGTVGIAIAVGVWIVDPWLSALFWGLVFLAVLWTLLLALADMFSNRAFFQRMQDEQLAEGLALKKELKDELQRLDRHRRNGDDQE